MTNNEHTTGRCIACQTTVVTRRSFGDGGVRLEDGTFIHHFCAQSADERTRQMRENAAHARRVFCS